MLAHTLVIVPLRLEPFPSAHGISPWRTGTLPRGAHGRGFEFWQDELPGEGRELDRCSHPAREIGFEGGLVVIAGTLRSLSFAGNFHHDVIAVFRGEEDG